MLLISSCLVIMNKYMIVDLRIIILIHYEEYNYDAEYRNISYKFISESMKIIQYSIVQEFILRLNRDYSRYNS